MGLIEHAKSELTLCGYDINFDNTKTIESDSDYSNSIGKSALELIEVFAKQGHSGVSARVVLDIFNRLALYKSLSNDLTDNPNEWEDMHTYCGEPTWQSKRNCSCFTHDMKSYYDIDDPDNNIFEKDADGQLTGYAVLKQLKDRKMVSIISTEGIL